MKYSKKIFLSRYSICFFIKHALHGLSWIIYSKTSIYLAFQVNGARPGKWREIVYRGTVNRCFTVCTNRNPIPPQVKNFHLCLPTFPFISRHSFSSPSTVLSFPSSFLPTLLTPPSSPFSLHLSTSSLHWLQNYFKTLVLYLKRWSFNFYHNTMHVVMVKTMHNKTLKFISHYLFNHNILIFSLKICPIIHGCCR